MGIFRPCPVLSVLTLIVLVFLSGLGYWQLERRAWKRDLLDRFEQTIGATPVTLSEGLCEGRARYGQRVSIQPPSGSEAAVRVYGRNEHGAPGWRRFSVLAAPSCVKAYAYILVEVGFDPLATVAGADDSLPQVTVLHTGLRFEPPLSEGVFTPAPDAAANAFYAFDQEGMAQVLGVPADSLGAAWWIARSDGAIPGYVTQTPPERHMAYAITWFALALALFAIYLIYHKKTGRLG